MKICHVIIDLDVGGAERALQRLVIFHAGCSQVEHYVVSLTDRGRIATELESSGIKVYNLGMKGLSDVPFVILKLVFILYKNRPEIVQTWMYHSDLIGGIAARLARVKKVIWGIRSTDIHFGGNKVTVLLRKFFCSPLSYVLPDSIVCAANVSRIVHEKLGYCSKKMVVIPNGFDIKKLNVDKSEGYAIRSACGISNSDFVIGSVARFSSVKDHGLFIDAASRLLHRHVDLKFLMVGKGIDHSNKKLVSMIKRTSSPQAFILLGERSDVSACFNAMNLFCLHSKSEGFPNVLGEAMALGLPCVATDVGDAAFLLGGHGIVVPSEDSHELANAIDFLLHQNKFLLSNMGSEAKSRIHSEFSMEVMIDRFHKLYMKLICQ